MALKGNDIESTTTTNNVDKKISIGGNGTVQALQDSQLSISDQATLNITSADADVAKAAIQGAQALAKGSNEIAAQVAASQAEFVDKASGQKTVLYVVAGVAGVAVLGLLMKGK